MSVAILPLEVPTRYFISVSQTLLPFVTFQTVTPFFLKHYGNYMLNIYVLILNLLQEAGCPSMH
jgi:hypothetical protein